LRTRPALAAPAARDVPDVGWNDFAAAVAPSVRVAETASRTGRRERHRVFAARGFSARFVIIPSPPPAVFIRFYGAGGALLGMDGGPAGYIGFDDDKTPVFGTPDDGVAVHTKPRIWPTPDDAGRIPRRVLLDGGRTVRAERIALRGEDGWVSFIPDARVRGLRSGEHGVALDLPPASAQCGYDVGRRF
jgi:hypothetical protein